MVCCLHINLIRIASYFTITKYKIKILYIQIFAITILLWPTSLLLITSILKLSPCYIVTASIDNMKTISCINISFYFHRQRQTENFGRLWHWSWASWIQTCNSWKSNLLNSTRLWNYTRATSKYLIKLTKLNLSFVSLIR